MQNTTRLPVGRPAERALKEKLKEALRIARLSKCKTSLSFQGLHIVVPPDANLEGYYEHWVHELRTRHISKVVETVLKARAIRKMR